MKNVDMPSNAMSRNAVSTNDISPKQDKDGKISPDPNYRKASSDPTLNS
jgi:hypothetical protein